MGSTINKDHNRLKVLETIRLTPRITRAEVANTTGLTPAAVTYIVTDLIKAGFVKELGRRSQNRGQPPIELGIRSDAAYTIGLHLESNFLSGIIMDLEGHIIGSSHTPFDTPPSPECILQTLENTTLNLWRDHQIDRRKLFGIGLATSEPLDIMSGRIQSELFEVSKTPTKQLSLPPSLGVSAFADLSLRQHLAESMRLPVFMDSSATAAAVGEYWYGEGRHYQHYMYITIAHNIGGGLFLNGRIHRGSHLHAGELGNFILKQQHCPNTSALRPLYLKEIASLSALEKQLGTSVTSQDITALYDEQDPVFMAWLTQTSHALAEATTTFDYLLDLDVILIGGQLPHNIMGELLERTEAERSALYVKGWPRRTSLKLGHTGHDSAVLGAAALPIYETLAPPTVTETQRGTIYRSGHTKTLFP